MPHQTDIISSMKCRKHWKDFKKHENDKIDRFDKLFSTIFTLTFHDILNPMVFGRKYHFIDKFVQCGDTSKVCWWLL